MSRFGSGLVAVFLLLLLTLLTAATVGCGGSSTTPTEATPASVALTPTSGAVQVGSTLQFIATARSSSNAIISIPVTYDSSNPSVLSFVPSAGGLACAGRWDSAGQVCTPGGIGTALVTATAHGVTSPAVTVYVHQPIDQIQLSLLNPPVPVPPCVTQASVQGVQNYLDFQAKAFSRGIDITNSVGSFSFSVTNTQVAGVSLNAPELENNNGQQVTQARITAASPGITQVYASSTGVSSLPFTFETCLIQSIQLQAGASPSNVTFTVTKSGSETITPTIIDRLGNTLLKASLTWSTLAPANVSVTTGGTAQGVAAGGSTITASCITPLCNIGVVPQKPVYASNVITGLVTATPATTTAYATTTQCRSINGCQPFLYPIATSSNLAANPVTLPSSPNSFVFTPGTAGKAFLGSTQGLMIFSPGSGTAGQVSQRNDVPGKVLAVSLDGARVVVSDTQSNPNQVFIFDQTASAGVAPIILLINAATAAQFSPDGQEIAIIASQHPAGDPLYVPGDALYVYSTVAALQNIALPGVPGPAPGGPTAVSYQASGALYFLSGVDPTGIQVRNTCDNSLAETIPVPRVPDQFQTLLDGVHALAVNSPGLQLFTAKVIPPPAATPTSPTSVTCPFGVAPPTSNFINLGQGTFTPLQLLVRPDNSKAYILASNLGSVFSFDLGIETVSAIPLAGNPMPLSASLTADGTLMYVGTSDATVHVISTASGQDIQQISFPANLNNNNNVGLCSNIPATCTPDLVAVAP